LDLEINCKSDELIRFDGARQICQNKLQNKLK
jgi:hypothetical protein